MSPQQLQTALADARYLADELLATAAWLALQLDKPLLLEGPPGSGKTALAGALAQALGRRLIRLQCVEGIAFTEAVADWQHARQLVALQAAAPEQREALADRLFTREFLHPRPLLQALEAGAGCVLLVDEVDRADPPFEAYLLELLAEWQISLPELGTLTAEAGAPLVLLTGNRSRELSDALRRRCLYHWLPQPSRAQEEAVLRLHLPGIQERLLQQVLDHVQGLRADPSLLQQPGLAETLDWARALQLLAVQGWPDTPGRHARPAPKASMTPEQLAQAQLDAYNARDLDAFLACYAEDVKVYRPPAAEPVMRGKAAMGAHYAANRFSLPDLHAELLGRLVVGNKVVDHERVHGVRAAPFEVIATYEVHEGRIAACYFFDAE